LFGSIQLSARPDGTAVLLLSDGVYQQQAGRVVGQVP